MLRITRMVGDDSHTLKLEGKLQGPWVLRLTMPTLAQAEASRICLDLSGLTFADAAACFVTDLEVVGCSSSYR